jgi:hypothetical protein
MKPPIEQRAGQLSGCGLKVVDLQIGYEFPQRSAFGLVEL